MAEDVDAGITFTIRPNGQRVAPVIPIQRDNLPMIERDENLQTNGPKDNPIPKENSLWISAAVRNKKKSES